MLSQKTKYALQALSKLAVNYGKGPTLIPLIAEEKGIPLRFLENILHELKQEGLLISHRGRNGGYEFRHQDGILLDDESFVAVRESLPMPVYPSYDFIDALVPEGDAAVRSAA